MGIFAGFIIACLTIIPLGKESSIQYYFAAALIIFFLGLKDDILVLTPLKKIIGQVIAASIIIAKGDIVIHSMYGFLGVYELPQLISLSVTLLTIIVIINSFNLIDGIDGLAAGLGIFTTLTFGIYFYMAGQIEMAAMALIMTGSLAAFLIFNRAPARIFMGDTGSLLVGLMNAILVIKFINIAASPAAVIPIESSAAIGVSILMIPLFDTLRVFAIRIFNRRSPFSPDRNHIHHILLDKGLAPQTVSLLLVAVNVLFLVFTYNLRHLNINLLIPILVATAFGGFSILYFYKRRHTLMVVAGKGDGGVLQLTKSKPIVPLTPAPKTAEQN
ncbi:MAG: undecaprenyl/decaprenyl-phosphate alpha-N-acetylglucosaminyl 1-phosphate transferase [Chitinophagaceae bacterium]|nr:undecaprenyl/decaprenyl-phosphate alpha-N-acetylglucosaminyl 1-phosphate transferase [Chitinophagaceae bacterium]